MGYFSLPCDCHIMHGTGESIIYHCGQKTPYGFESWTRSFDFQTAWFKTPCGQNISWFRILEYFLWFPKPHYLKTRTKNMLKALADVHSKNIIHLDIKPENFLLVEGVLKIIDFGLAKKIPKNRDFLCRFILDSVTNSFTSCDSLNYVFLFSIERKPTNICDFFSSCNFIFFNLFLFKCNCANFHKGPLFWPPFSSRTIFTKNHHLSTHIG
jgi:serine/threonine protein kinase